MPCLCHKVIPLHFNLNQKYQLDAIDAVLRVFEVQPVSAGNSAYPSPITARYTSKPAKNKGEVDRS